MMAAICESVAAVRGALRLPRAREGRSERKRWHDEQRCWEPLLVMLNERPLGSTELHFADLGPPQQSNYRNHAKLLVTYICIYRAITWKARGKKLTFFYSTPLSESVYRTEEITENTLNPEALSMQKSSAGRGRDSLDHSWEKPAPQTLERERGLTQVVRNFGKWVQLKLKRTHLGAEIIKSKG